MKNQNIFEALVGFIVLFIAIFVVIYAYRVSDKLDIATNSYQLIARFNNINGINIGSDIKVAGVKIGTVEDIKLDNENFIAVAKLSFISSIKIPSDSSISIVTSGLFGGKYLELQPGGSFDEILEDGEEIEFTESAVSIEGLIKKFITK